MMKRGMTAASMCGVFLCAVAGPATAAYVDVVKSHDPVGHWRLGETGGRFAQDETGRHKGQYVNRVGLGGLILLRRKTVRG